MFCKPFESSDIAVLLSSNRFFFISAVLSDLKDSLVVLQEYYISVQTVTLQLLLNINSVTATFYWAGSLLDLMRDFRSSCQGSWQFLLHNFLKDMQVKTTHLKTAKRTYKIKVLAELMWSSQPAASVQEVSFHWDETHLNMTIEEYHNCSTYNPLWHTCSLLKCWWSSEYNLCLQSAPALIVNVDNAQHSMWMSVKLCNVISDQVVKKKLLSDQTQKMIKVTCQWSAVNADLSVEKGAQVMSVRPDHLNGLICYCWPCSNGQFDQVSWCQFARPFLGFRLRLECSKWMNAFLCLQL